jgi:hypothetical protein
MGGQKLTASQRGDSWHKTGETGKLPDVVILGNAMPRRLARGVDKIRGGVCPSKL